MRALSILMCAYHGNDTIDPYPLMPWEAKKILCITPKVFALISRAFKTFRRSIKTPYSRKVVNHACNPGVKKLMLQTCSQRAYEPTDAIQCNICDYRRWVRVKEWFNDYNPDAQTSKRTLFIK